MSTPRELRVRELSAHNDPSLLALTEVLYRLAINFGQDDPHSYNKVLELRADIYRITCDYDHARSLQIQELTQQLIDLRMTRIIPPPLDPKKG